MFGTHPSRWLTLLIIGGLSAFGCVGSDTGQGGESGSLSLDLMLAPGVEINEVDWALSGNGMDPMSGTIDTSDPNSTPSVEVFGLAPGEDYTVLLEATSADGEISCRGSAEFDISVGELTDVMVFMNCKLPETLGGVRVNGKFNICAQIEKMVVSPLQTSVGSQIDLAGLGTDAEGDAITYVWSATGGSIDDPNATATTYTCGQAGDQTITLTVTDEPEYCMDDWTVKVTCIAGGGDLCEDVTCDDTGNECTEAECDPADGQCKTENVEDGTDCDGGEGTCSGGVCVEVDLCEGVICEDDGNDCTETECDPVDGVCKTENVTDGTDCDGGIGMCIGGACIGNCEGVTCDDTGNECTAAMCNVQTGLCDEMNVPDGTTCNGGAGACSSGVCIDDNPCQGVDCSSDDDCVQDGTCDPADGLCDPGDPQPADTACDLSGTDDGVCDGAGTCVECNADAQCPDDGNECTAEACTSGECASSPVADGTACDADGSAGTCMSGVCEAAMLCADAETRCDDDNACTQNLCDPATGECSNPPEADGTQCFCPVCGAEGVCDMGICIDPCDGVDCSDGNECTADLCEVGICSNPNLGPGSVCNQDGGIVCDGAGACVECIVDGNCDVELNETCVDNVCVAQATGCGTQSQTVQIGCSNGVTDAQSPFPNQMTVTVDEAVLANQAFTLDASGVGAFPKFFLDAAQSTVPGGVRSAIVEGFNVTVEVGNGSGQVLLQADPSGITPGLISFCTFPFEQVCTADADCLVPPCLPPVLVAEVPVSEDCGAGGFCEGLGQGFADGPAAQCNITDAPEFCVASDLQVPLFAPGGPQAVTAGASGDVTFNWAVDPVTEVCGASTSDRCTANGGNLPTGALILPPSIYGNPVDNPETVGLNGIRLNVAGALFVALQCSAGSDGGECSGGSNDGAACLSAADCPGGGCFGVGVDDDIIVATDPATLPACPIN